MAKIIPDLDEIKAELRIDFDDDDDLIEKCINAACTHVCRYLNWIDCSKETSGENLTINCSRFFGNVPIRIPRRGILVADASTPVAVIASLSYKDEDGTAVEKKLTYDSTEMFFDQGVEINRQILYLKPVDDWSFIESKDREYRLRVFPGDTPPDMLIAMHKLTVDSYRYNGVASEPMKTAVDRLLAPLRVYGSD